MAEKAEWVSFDSESDEALSLSDLPISKQAQNINNPSCEQEEEEEESRSGGSPSKPDEQFEFRIVSGNGNKNSNNNSSGEEHLCAAEDVFFHGQLLPLGPTRPVSRSDSAASLSFDSSTSVSRSLSSNSGASSSELAPHSTSLSRISSNTLCACPSSPSPRVRSVGRNCGGRRSNGSAPPVGWGLLRLGVAMAPEMEWSDIRVRVARGGSVKNVGEKRGNAVFRFLGGCKCSPEDAVCAQEKGEGLGRRRVAAGLRERRERMFQWLDDLSLGKEPLIKFGL